MINMSLWFSISESTSQAASIGLSSQAKGSNMRLVEDIKLYI